VAVLKALTRLALLRGVCQTPAHLAHARGYLADEGLDVDSIPRAFMDLRFLDAAQQAPAER